MRIAYVSTYNSQDIDQWSGLGYHMCKSLSDQGLSIVLINCSVPVSSWIKFKARLIRSISGKTYQVDRDPGHLKRIAEIAKQKLAKEEYDLVLSPGSLAVSYLKVSKPIIFWTDATYDCLVDFYPDWKSLSKSTIHNGNKAEQIAINKASMIFYTSEWARQNAISVYRANPSKVKVIPSGSNMEGKLSEDEVEILSQTRLGTKKVNLLFVGVDWNRKGGDAAVETVEKLIANGIDASLTVIGCTLPSRYKTLPFIISFPFISKNTQEGVEKLTQQFERATFFLLPTKAECFAVVFAEASSFGLPVITTNVGGNTSAVLDGKTGYCLPLTDFPENAANKISQLLQSKEVYKQFSLNSYQHYRESINWNVIGKKAVAEMKTLIPEEVLELNTD
jgi:glycosyltransferase involved in cell wall biosynthesis